jgi:hypothetical protein
MDNKMNRKMRVIVRVVFPAEAGNRAVKDPNFIKNIHKVSWRKTKLKQYTFPFSFT